MTSCRTGRLVVFSGLDGAGKSTQIELLIKQLRAEGKKPVYLWSRGGYTGLMQKSKMLARYLLRHRLPPPGISEQRTRSFRKGWVRKLWITLAIVDLIRVYGIQVRWWRLRGYTVICDRYIWDTKIDFQMNLKVDNVEQWLLWRVLSNLTPRPDTAFLLLIPVEESIRRSEIKGEPYRNSSSELEERLKNYRLLAQEGHWHVLDGRCSVCELQAWIKLIVQNDRQATVQSD